MNWEFELEGDEYQVCSSERKTYIVYRIDQTTRTKIGGFITESEDPDYIRDEAELVIAENS